MIIMMMLTAQAAAAAWSKGAGAPSDIDTNEEYGMGGDLLPK